MIHSDIFLKQGSSKKICEDYIVSGNDPFPYIILSDGCSTAENTEMGARILCHLAKKFIQYRASEIENITYDDMGSWIIHNSEIVTRMMGLKISCLTATLIISFFYNEKVYIYMYGDGGTILEHKDGSIDIIKTEFSNNAPYYLIYKIDSLKNMEYYKVNKDLRISSIDTEEKQINSLPYNHPIYGSYKMEDYRSISICSDGLFSFIKENNMQQELVSPKDFIKNFLSFKVTKGDFLKRRMRNAMKELEINQITHFDDFSMGTFLFEE